MEQPKRHFSTPSATVRIENEAIMVTLALHLWLANCWAESPME